MPNDILKKVNSMVSSVNQDKINEKNRMENDRKNLVLGIAQDLVRALKPTLEKIANTSSSNMSDVQRMISAIRIQPPVVNVPAMPRINVPQPRVSVNVPDIRVPDINMPDEMDIKGFVGLMGYDRGLLENPLPVQIRDASGKPVNFFENLTSIISSGGGGGIAKQVRINNGTANPVPVALVSGGATGSTASALIDSAGVQYSGSNPLPVTVTSGASATTAVNIVDSTGVAYTGDNPVPVDLIDITTLATSAKQLADDHNVNVSNMIPAVETGLATSALQLPDGHNVTIDNGGPIEVDGTVVVSGITASVAVTMIDSSGIGYSGANPLPIAGTVLVSDITASVKTALIDSTGEQYSGSNPVPVTGAVSGTVTVSSITASTSVNLEDSTGVGYSGSNPVPTRVVNVRGNLKTAYATENEVEETTLLAGVAGEYHDLVMVMGANESDAAINVDVRATKGGTVLMTLAIPANGTAGVSLPQAMPQQDIDASWTVQNNATDNSNTIYSVTGLFKKEV